MARPKKEPDQDRQVVMSYKDYMSMVNFVSYKAVAPLLTRASRLHTFRISKASIFVLSIKRSYRIAKLNHHGVLRDQQNVVLLASLSPSHFAVLFARSLAADTSQCATLA